MNKMFELLDWEYNTVPGYLADGFCYICSNYTPDLYYSFSKDFEPEIISVCGACAEDVPDEDTYIFERKS